MRLRPSNECLNFCNLSLKIHAIHKGGYNALSLSINECCGRVQAIFNEWFLLRILTQQLQQSALLFTGLPLVTPFPFGWPRVVGGIAAVVTVFSSYYKVFQSGPWVPMGHQVWMPLLFLKNVVLGVAWQRGLTDVPNSRRKQRRNVWNMQWKNTVAVNWAVDTSNYAIHVIMYNRST